MILMLFWHLSLCRLDLKPLFYSVTNFYMYIIIELFICLNLMSSRGFSSLQGEIGQKGQPGTTGEQGKEVL